MNAIIDHLDRLLVARLQAVEGRTQTYAPGFELGDAVLHSPRLILVQQGTVNYRLDDKRWSLTAGDVVLVPAMFKRSWTAGRRGPLTLSWFAYCALPSLEELPTLLRTSSLNAATETAALDRIRKLSDEHGDDHSLAAEGEMKAMLARFLVCAKPASGDLHDMATGTQPAELAVADAVRWLGRHYAKQDAIDDAVRRSQISEKYFRQLFRKRVGISPHRYLTQLRMRAARFHLHETQETVKQIAKRVGFNSPFHFSRTYSKFWGHPPADDRKHTV